MTFRPLVLRYSIESVIMLRFSSRVVFNTSFTCRSHDFPNMTAVLTPASRSMLRVWSFEGWMSLRRVLPKAATSEFVSVSCLTALKYSTSLGFEPGHPPSMYLTPSWSSLWVMLSLSWREKDMP